MHFKKLIPALGFLPKENAAAVFQKQYAKHDDYKIEIDLDKEQFHFGNKITSEKKAVQHFAQAENWVVLECVDRLLTKGYAPEHITLEKTYPSGHGTSGRLDILVARDDGSAYLMIECKTWGREYEKELKNLHRNGGQLFTYFQQDKSADVLMLYASGLEGQEIQYANTIINIEKEYRETSNVEDFFHRWNKIPKANGIFDAWVRPYSFESKALTPQDLKDIAQRDSSFIFNQFLEILRHNVVSDKPNAFNKIFTLFLCKIYDEKHTRADQELAFQWFYSPYQYEGIHYPPDDHVSFQKRLTDLYAKGMHEFLEKEVTDISDAEFDRNYSILDAEIRKKIKDTLTKIRLEKNNEFAIKEVFNTDSFEENAVVVKEVVELLQGFKIRYTKKQQYLSDFFELLLTTGLKQESGQYFTPVPIAQFIIRSLPLDGLTNEKLGKGERDNLLPKIIDHASGSGHFITESMHVIQQLIDEQNPEDYLPDTAKKVRSWKDDKFDWALRYIYGIEKDYRLVKVGKVGCYLHGDGLAKIVHSDGLGNFKNTKEYSGLLCKTDADYPQENKQFDVVVSNPPYSVSSFKNNARKYYTERDFEIYHHLTDNSKEIECLFVERTKQLLKDDGIAGIILPSSMLSNTGIYTQTREIILRYFDVLAIVEFGSNTFMETGTNTVTLFLRRRNNATEANIKKSVEGCFINLRDLTINVIENPITKYLAHVWEDVSFGDYKSLLQKKPNEKIKQHDIFREYDKKIKATKEQEKWTEILETEKEKLLYFILAYPQRLVLIKTGRKDAEKRFLGYEFSKRRGSEGIHPVQRSKSIDECTYLYDVDTFANPAKASHYVYHAFKGELDLEIHEQLQKNISYQNLADMLTFDRVNFDKNISLAVKRKVESIWEYSKLIDILEVLESGKRPRGGVGEYQTGVPSLGGEHIGLNGRIHISKDNLKFVPEEYFNKSTQGILKNLDILICKDGALTGKTALFYEDEIDYSKSMINEHVFLLRTNDKSIQKYLFNFLFSQRGQELLKSNISGQAQGGLNRSNLLNIKIPLPPKYIQQKIVDEVEALEKKERETLEEIEKLKKKIPLTVEKLRFESKCDIVNIRDIAETQYGYTEKATDKGDVRYLRITDINKDGSIRLDNEAKFINPNSEIEKQFLLKDKDIVIARSGSVGKSAFYKSSKYEKMIFASYLIRLFVNKEKVLPEYLFNFTKTKMYWEQVKTSSTAVTQPNLNAEKIKEFKIPLPSISEQEKIVAQIEKIEHQISQLEEQTTEIPQQREAVLKKYLQ